MLDSAWERLRGLGLRHSDRVICNSHFVKTHAISAFGLQPDRVEVAPCGVDRRLIELAERLDRRAMRSAIAGPLGCEGYALTFATGDAREGYGALPAIWAAARAAGYPGALVVAGVMMAARYAGDLRRAFTAEGLTETVSWVPFLDQTETGRLAALYAAADFYLELSRHEGFGMQLAEAMACGAVCFSTGCGALEEVGGGFPLPLPADPSTAGRAIAEAWRAGVHKRDVTAQVAHAQAFTWDTAGIQVAAFARSAVGSPLPLGVRR
jgi:glycosyltransferase involved in cell wall biosynthesis